MATMWEKRLTVTKLCADSHSVTERVRLMREEAAPSPHLVRGRARGRHKRAERRRIGREREAFQPGLLAARPLADDQEVPQVADDHEAVRAEIAAHLRAPGNGRHVLADALHLDDAALGHLP